MSDTIKNMVAGWNKRRAAMTEKERTEEDVYLARIRAEYEVAGRPEADDHLVLVRLDMPRWKSTYWIMAPTARKARNVMRDHLSAGCTESTIRVGLRTAKAKTKNMREVGDRLVTVGYQKEQPLSEAAGETFSRVGLMLRGQSRVIGYESRRR